MINDHNDYMMQRLTLN